MTDPRPRIAPGLLADILDAAPSRVGRRLDAEPRTADSWTWTADGGGWTVLAGTETVTLTGTGLTQPDQVACTCLLSPRCLHLLATVSLLDPLDPDPEPSGPPPAPAEASSAATTGPTVHGGEADSGTDTADSTGTAAPADSGPAEGPRPVTGPGSAAASVVSDPLGVPVGIDDAARAAARAAWSAGARILASGVRAGAVHRSDLLRASALARTARLPWLAAACATVAAGPRDHDTHLFALGEYTAALTALLDVSWRLGAGPDGERPAVTLADIGTGRRSYTEIGSLRLHGLGTERVVTASGQAGAVTHLVSFDRNGHPDFWRIGDVAPGDGSRADQAYATRVNFGGTSRSHRELGRSGLIAQRIRASADGRLGGGAATTAAATDGRPWNTGPLAGLWSRPFDEQITAALAAQAAPARRSGSDLVFADLTVIGPAPGTEGVAVAEESSGRTLLLASKNAQDTYRAHNLALLARTPGTSLRAIARPVPERPGTLVPLTVEPRGGPSLPATLRGRVNLSLDALPSPGAPRSTAATGSDPGNFPAPGPDLGLNGLERILARVAEAGREAATAAGPLADRLRAHHLATGAELLTGLVEAGRERLRTPTGESVPPPPDALATAWLAAAAYSASVRAHLNTLAWTESL